MPTDKQKVWDEEKAGRRALGVDQYREAPVQPSKKRGSVFAAPTGDPVRSRKNAPCTCARPHAMKKHKKSGGCLCGSDCQAGVR